MSERLNEQQVKQALGIHAAKMVNGANSLGLGTGTTANEFIRALVSQSSPEQLKHTPAIATSFASERLVSSSGMVLLRGERQLIQPDCTVDGADQIDPAGNMLKGLGGALLKEKIAAQLAKRYIIIAHKNKQMDCLKGIVPLEIVRFGAGITIEALRRTFGLRFTFRRRAPALGFKQGEEGKEELALADEERFITEEGHYLIDAYLGEGRYPNPADLHRNVIRIPGVVETGFFPYGREGDCFAPEFVLCDDFGVISSWKPI
jgi:ribose 5-phosphate isomerase A